MPTQQPILQTPRLTLRPFEMSDADMILALRSDPETMRHVPRFPMRERAEAAAWIEMNWATRAAGRGFNWAICLPGQPELIGTAGFFNLEQENSKAELGYMLARDHWSKGMITEAVAEVIRFGFEHLNLHRFEAQTDPENLASNRVLKKLGFRQEAHLRENLFFDNRFLDTFIFGLLYTEFKS